MYLLVSLLKLIAYYVYVYRYEGSNTIKYEQHTCNNEDNGMQVNQTPYYRCRKVDLIEMYQVNYSYRPDRILYWSSQH